MNCVIIKVGTCQQWIRRKEVSPMDTKKKEKKKEETPIEFHILDLLSHDWTIEEVEEAHPWMMKIWG